mmetsp:Transcript_35988/g.80998  ORF Transcript_35988/g.80998 Transcript_35988/m.80998 type:complete len:278 (-) Transcript_35988:108-941(-)
MNVHSLVQVTLKANHLRLELVDLAVAREMVFDCLVELLFKALHSSLQSLNVELARFVFVNGFISFRLHSYDSLFQFSNLMVELRFLLIKEFLFVLGVQDQLFQCGNDLLQQHLKVQLHLSHVCHNRAVVILLRQQHLAPQIHSGVYQLRSPRVADLDSNILDVSEVFEHLSSVCDSGSRHPGDADLLYGPVLLADEKVNGTVRDVSSNQKIDDIVDVCHDAVDLENLVADGKLPTIHGWTSNHDVVNDGSLEHETHGCLGGGRVPDEERVLVSEGVG